MDRFQKIASEILDRVCSFRGDNEGWKISKQTVCLTIIIVIINFISIVKFMFMPGNLYI